VGFVHVLFPAGKLKIHQNEYYDREDYSAEETDAESVQLGETGTRLVIAFYQVSVTMFAADRTCGDRLFAVRALGGFFRQRHASK
jgi:hypothetical protein